MKGYKLFLLGIGMVVLGGAEHFLGILNQCELPIRTRMLSFVTRAFPAGFCQHLEVRLSSCAGSPPLLSLRASR